VLHVLPPRPKWEILHKGPAEGHPVMFGLGRLTNAAGTKSKGFGHRVANPVCYQFTCVCLCHPTWRIMQRGRSKAAQFEWKWQGEEQTGWSGFVVLPASYPLNKPSKKNAACWAAPSRAVSCRCQHWRWRGCSHNPVWPIFRQTHYTPPTMALRNMAIRSRDARFWTQNLGLPFNFNYQTKKKFNIWLAQTISTCDGGVYI